jgi:predicted metalloprotease with PDZ domain
MRHSAGRIVAAGIAMLLAGAGTAHAARLAARPPGDIQLQVDLTRPLQRLFMVHESFPASPGPLVLYYPKWVPGEHSPSGTLDGVAGLVISNQAGARVNWSRDGVDLFALHLQLPAGTTALQLDFQMLSPGEDGKFGQGVAASPQLQVLAWNQVLFYPEGATPREQRVQAEVRLPDGWQFATALDPQARSSASVRFAPVSIEQLVDSPLMAGVNFARYDLAPGGAVPVHLDLVADYPADLRVSDAQLAAARSLVEQAQRLFGARHYQHYDFLFTLSDDVTHFGLEHSQSSDDRLDARFYTDPDTYIAGGDLLAHEYVHSWNGKFRRPAGLATPDFQQPMRGELLWVYEGLTEYLGAVLAARAGQWTPEQFRDQLALVAASLDHRPGRSWRSLQDTADAAQRLYYVPRDWASWRRQVDFYDEGKLLWLEVDTTIRELSAGRRSLDDFARAFYGSDDGSFVVHPYTFDDVVKALEQVQPHDWRGLLRARLDSHAEGAPLGGLQRGGWRLGYGPEPGPFAKADARVRKRLDLRDSLGLQIATGGAAPGTVQDVIWGSPAFAAGFAPGMRVQAINGRDFDADRIDELLRQAQQPGSAPIELLVRVRDAWVTLRIDYHGGPRYPRLERDMAVPDRLGEIIRPR